MTRDEIRKLADLAGWPPTQLEMASEAEWARLERFAALVAAAEREACAKVCDDETSHESGYLAYLIRARSTP